MHLKKNKGTFWFGSLRLFLLTFAIFGLFNASPKDNINIKLGHLYTRVRLPSKPASEPSNGQNLTMLELWELVS